MNTQTATVQAKDTDPVKPVKTTGQKNIVPKNYKKKQKARQKAEKKARKTMRKHRKH